MLYSHGHHKENNVSLVVVGVQHYASRYDHHLFLQLYVFMPERPENDLKVHLHHNECMTAGTEQTAFCM